MANINETKIKDMITVYNKVDLSPYRSYSKRNNFISAYTGFGIENFKNKLMNY